MANFLVVLAAYLLGSVSCAVLVSKCFGMPDPRSYGSKNPGATNVLRSGKKMAAVLTLLGDAAKGWIAVAAAVSFQAASVLTPEAVAGVVVAVLVGHMWPVFFGFKGGKGVATAFGSLLALSWPVALICAAVWLLVAFGFKRSSLAALAATVCSPFVSCFFMANRIQIAAVAVTAILVLWRHKKNIRNLFRGEEGKIGERAAEHQNDSSIEN